MRELSHTLRRYRGRRRFIFHGSITVTAEASERNGRCLMTITEDGHKIGPSDWRAALATLIGTLTNDNFNADD